MSCPPRWARRRHTSFWVAWMKSVRAARSPCPALRASAVTASSADSCAAWGFIQGRIPGYVRDAVMPHASIGRHDK